MSKVVELESNPEPIETENVDPKDQANRQTEEKIHNLMKKVYILGLSAGMKTMCGSILEKMNQNKKLNAQKQLNLLRQWCNHNLAIQDKAESIQKEPQTLINKNMEEHNDEKAD